MAFRNYFPISQSYAPGAWSGSSFLLAIILSLLLIGIIIFLYMLVVKPDGTLTVIYEYRAKSESKKCPQCAETVKYEAKLCRFCRYEFDEIQTTKN